MKVRSLAAAIAAGSALATAAFPTRSRARRRLAHVTVLGLALDTVAGAAGRVGVRRAVTGAGAVVAAGQVIEMVGQSTGVPFGRYRYSSALRPQVARVPVVVPGAWLAMAGPAQAVGAALGGRRAPTRVLAGSLAMTAWDLFVDPQMTAEGYWSWPDGGRYRGTPASNFAGWLIGGCVVIGLAHVAWAGTADPSGVLRYVTVAGFHVAAFATFLDDRFVALVGGAAMTAMAGAAYIGARMVARMGAR